MGSPSHALRRCAAVVSVLLASLAITASPAAMAAPGCVTATGVFKDQTPWPQRLLDPGRVWPLTTGSGVSVAVLGTGVDAGNAQFGQDQVSNGADLGTGRSAANDCDGRGTFAAGLIAARPNSETTFAGMAPGARIVPVRYTQSTNQGGGAQVDPALIAAAIRSAANAGIKVICVVVPTTVDSSSLRDAVQQARQADAVVVVPTAAQGLNGATYPAADTNVLTVAAVGQDGAPISDSATGHVDIAAPGKDLVGLAGGNTSGLGHIWPVENAAYAAAFVAGTAALVRAYRPNLSAAQVVHRIEATAGGAAGGNAAQLGSGIVNPYAAVTAEGIDGAARAPAVTAPTVIAAARPAPRHSAADTTAILVASSALVVALFLVTFALVARRDRRVPGN